MGFVAEWAGPIDTLCGIPIPGLLQVEQDQPISLILFEHLSSNPKIPDKLQQVISIAIWLAYFKSLKL